MSFSVHIVFLPLFLLSFSSSNFFINHVGNLTRRLTSASSVGSIEESYFLQASLDSSDGLSERRNIGEGTLSPYYMKSMTPSAFEAAIRQKEGELASYMSRLVCVQSFILFSQQLEPYDVPLHSGYECAAFNNLSHYRGHKILWTFLPFLLFLWLSLTNNYLVHFRHPWKLSVILLLRS